MTIRALIVATRRRSPGRAVAAAMAVAAVTGAITAGTAHAVAARTEPAAAAAAPRAMKSACPPPGPGYVRCFALFAPQTAVNAAIAAGVTGAAARPRGWGAKAIKSAYKLPTSRNPHEEVAVVEAYDTPNLASDVAAYRTEYGLPLCTTASGCLRKVNQNGKASPLPASGRFTGWDLEAILDADMVSAACPRCKILVVEARSATFGDLGAAVNTAARLGAVAISNSYGAEEDGHAMRFAGDYRHPGHAVVASSGDWGFGPANFPADLAAVTAAGGTELARAKNTRGWSERVWSVRFADGSGSGCSAYITKPTWQHDRHCRGRTVADVSAVASNIAVYDQDYGGWAYLGGTSVASPLIAGIYALAGNAATITPRHAYAHRGSLFDVTVGNNDVLGNGANCGHDYLCTAKKDYDAPSGLGTPDGTGAF